MGFLAESLVPTDQQGWVCCQLLGVGPVVCGHRGYRSGQVGCFPSPDAEISSDTIWNNSVRVHCSRELPAGADLACLCQNTQLHCETGSWEPYLILLPGTRSGGAGTAGAVQKSTFPYYSTELPALGSSLQWVSALGRKPHGLQWLWSIKNWYPKSWGSWCTLTEFWTWKVSHWCDWHFCFVNPEILHDWEILHLRVLVFVLCRHLYDPILGDEATEVGVVQLKTSWLILGNNGLQFLKHLIFLLPHRIQIHKCPCDRRRLVPAVWTAFAS